MGRPEAHPLDDGIGDTIVAVGLEERVGGEESVERGSTAANA